MEIPLLDELDIEILKHRDVHFGGNFDVMIEYYENDGIGIVPDFDIERIEELQTLQEELGEDLSARFLTMPILEEIAKVKALYLKLREMYDHNSPFIADLILTEEEEPLQEIQAILAEGEKMVEPLLHLVDSPDFYNPLYPGYGRAPAFAACCLAQLKNPKAISHLFFALGGENLDVEEALLSCIAAFGAPAKTFLLERLKASPITKENLNAAIALAFFPPEDEIAKAALHLLKDKQALSYESFFPYLVCLAEGLTSPEDRKAFKEIPFPTELKLDADAILRSWK